MAGRFAQAEAAYRKVLEQQPAQAETLHLLGLLYLENGRPDTAAEFIARAVKRKPRVPDYRHHLGLAWAGQGRLADAEGQFRQAIELRPEFVGAHNDLGNVLKQQDKTAEAELHYRRTLELNPSHAAAHNNLGVILAAGGNLDEAIVYYKRALELDPRDADTHLNLGNALRTLRRPDEAIAAYRNAIASRPDLAEAHLGLGASLQECAQLDDAIASYTDVLAIDPRSVDGHNKLGTALREAGQPEAAIPHFRAALEADALWEIGLPFDAVAAWQQAVALKPDDAKAQNNLGAALCDLGALADAETAVREALALRPQYPEAHFSLGNVLKGRGNIEEAITAYRRALTLDPTLDRAYSNLLLALHYHTGMDALEMRREHERWAEHYALPFAQHIEPHANDPAATRRLRIGYLSPDFRAHSVAAFIEPVLATHDREAFEVICYANIRRSDPVTERLRALGHQWRYITFASDAEVAARVRDDRIDILVDLAGHTSGNRLLVLARKPAPIQVAYLGYPDTWGFDAMDYWLTDTLSDPPGAERCYIEQLVRLPQGFSCYQSPADSPAVGPLPARASGRMTLGSFNNIAKVNAEVIACWANILTALPDAQLLLKDRALDDGETRDRLVSLFAEKGVNAKRVQMIGWVPGKAAHLELYNRTDIALDSFPYNGHTITCEALWMGVPVVTLAGQTHAGRVGASLLTYAGLPELIAESPEHYIALTVALASDLERLQDLRQGLRTRLQRSALMDAVGLTRSIESAYREMWKKYCEMSGK
jgi:predicted O-linked N-acetylglucosamine transferase (SPINDLY family)